MPDFEAWAVFARVAELRSFSAAAASLGISSATASKAVTRLERRLGATLFHRTTRSLSITPSGQALAARAAALLEQAEEAEDAALADATRPRGLVRVAAPMTFGVGHVAPALPALFDRYPEIEITLHLDDARTDLVAAGIDIALRIGRLTDSVFKARRLMPVEVRLAASPDYLRRAGVPEHPADLARHPVVGYSNAPRPDRIHLYDATGAEVAVPRNGPLVTNSADAMLPLLRAGKAIGFVPDFALAADLAAGHLVHVLPGWGQRPGALYLITPSTGPRTARIAAVADFFVERFAGPAAGRDP